MRGHEHRAPTLEWYGLVLSMRGREHEHQRSSGIASSWMLCTGVREQKCEDKASSCQRPPPGQPALTDRLESSKSMVELRRKAKQWRNARRLRWPVVAEHGVHRSASKNRMAENLLRLRDMRMPVAGLHTPWCRRSTRQGPNRVSRKPVWLVLLGKGYSLRAVPISGAIPTT